MIGVLPCADARGPAPHFEAVHLRHVHVEQDRREFLLQQPFQGLRAGKRATSWSEPVQDSFVGQEPGRLVVDQQDVDAYPSIPCPRRAVTDARHTHERKSSSVLTGLAM